MIDDPVLLDAGYRGCQSGSCKLNLSDYLFQKRVEIDGVTRYFINVWQYYAKPEHGGYPGGSTAEATMYFRGRDRPYVTMEYHGAKTASEIEAFFDMAWNRLEMGPDAHNQRD